jgi:hypothetical protein
MCIHDQIIMISCKHTAFCQWRVVVLGSQARRDLDDIDRSRLPDGSPRMMLSEAAGENARGDAAAAWSEHYAVPAAFIVRINAGTPEESTQPGNALFFSS